MKIEHIALYVNDLEGAKDFFTKYFEAQVVENYYQEDIDFSSYFLSFDGGSRLELMHKPGMKDDAKDLNRTGYIHVAFSVGSRERVNELTERLRNDGFIVEHGPVMTGDGYYESNIIAFEGNQIEITI